MEKLFTSKENLPILTWGVNASGVESHILALTCHFSSYDLSKLPLAILLDFHQSKPTCIIMRRPAQLALSIEYLMGHKIKSLWCSSHRLESRLISSYRMKPSPH
jgi:hypothetical protein